ncbi:MAG: HNH endonuclease [Candidatus Nanoarchaeia archaeon]|nr:HNH endonuclease [Candidatus Nanoarchaeia archaeon]MDD5358074.1 HNH endonuclease [Candidatus Nanoarchaeia archaeon]MDD5589262.1 HNH endonuclease [Candidatus Nanoarchaeia archaeon]
MKNNLPLPLIRKILERDSFKCQKCGFEDPSGENLEVHHINPKIFNGLNESSNLSTLCSICHKYAPDSEKEFKKYLSEKIDSKLLDTFRKSDYSISKKTKLGMDTAFKKGRHITKAPKGYKLLNKQLIKHDEESAKVKNIFEEFLNSNISLTQLAKKYNLTTSGLIKLLKNTTYLGKVKFANHESDGQHEPIIDKQLFEQVQNKLSV